MNQWTSTASAEKSGPATKALGADTLVKSTQTGKHPTIQPSGNTSSIINKLGPALFRAAWLAVLLGISLQLILTVISVIGGKEPKTNTLIVETANKISWSLVTCVGLALGMLLARMNLSMVGFAGFLAASLSFTIARAVQMGLNEALSIATPGGPFPYTVALIKGAEYAILGIALGWIAKKKAGSVLVMIAAGLTIAVIFSNILMAVAVATAKQPIPSIDVVLRYLNEAIFPVGCTSVIIATKISDFIFES